MLDYCKFNPDTACTYSLNCQEHSTDARTEVYSLAFESPFIGQVIVAPDGRFVRCNNTFCTLLGYSEETLQKKNWGDLTHPDDVEKSFQYVKDLHEEKQRPQGLLKRYIKANGTIVQCEIYASLIRNKDGTPRFFITHVLDVTKNIADQMVLENLVLERTRELRATNVALESFAYAASHDLREPLNKIMAFGKRLRTKYCEGLDPRGQEYLEIMESAAGRMLALIDDLLVYSRAGSSGDTQTYIDYQVAITSALSDLECKIEESGAEIRIDLDAPPLFAHRARLHQLFLNLIGNAIKFHRTGVPPVIEIRSRVEESQTVITITDNGIGFEDTDSAKIFQVFRRLHNRTEYPGTGIGLALCQRIVESYGGTIKASGRNHEGATFTIRFPIGGPNG
jgi:PAS domain S-box-containing protein